MTRSRTVERQAVPALPDADHDGRWLRGLGQTLITLGVVVLLFCFYEVYVTNRYTDHAQAQLGDRIERTWADPAASGPVLPGDALAVLRIPRIGKTGPVGPHGALVVLEGVSRADLMRGPGHYPGTALPGEVGNVVISGHRTTYGAPFNRLDELAVGDPVVIETRTTWFTYRVTGSQVVSPHAVEVTYPTPGRRGVAPTERLLTLTTCNPKYSARQRLIVSAALESATPRAAGQPAVLNGGA